MRLKSKDIAKLLNISPAAVSLAINNKPGVSADTRQKVNAVVEAYYASGSFTADAGVSGESKSIALIIHKKRLIIPNRHLQDTLDGMQAFSFYHGYNLEISYYNEAMDHDVLICGLNDDRIAGVLIFATEMTYEDVGIYSALKKPVVYIDARFAHENIDMVTFTNRSALSNAVNYAYHMGHRKIGFLKSGAELVNFADRYKGYLEGLRNNGLPYDPARVFTLDVTIDSACDCFMKVLEKPKDELPTIFLTDLDYVVAGALRAIKMKGYSVPDDFSLIGFDDLDLMSELQPALTTIHIKQDIGPIAARRLIEKIENDGGYHLNIELATELILRDSVKDLN